MLKILPLFFVLLFVSCASEVKKEIEVEKEQISDYYSKDQAIEKAKKMIMNSDKLNSDQKEQFITLHKKTVAKILELNQEIYKTKMLLLKELVQAEEYNLQKVNVLMNSVKNLYGQKATLSLDSLLAAKKILGINYSHYIDQTWLDYDRVH